MLLYAEAITANTVRQKRKAHEHMFAGIFVFDTLREQREVDEHAVQQMGEAPNLKLHAAVMMSNIVQKQRKVYEQRVVQHMCTATNTEETVERQEAIIESQPLIDLHMSRPRKGMRRTSLRRTSRKGIRSRNAPSSMSGHEWSVHTRNARMTKMHTA